MADFLFWVIGSCFFLGGLFCLFLALVMFISWRQGAERVSFAKFLAWFGMGITSEALMVVFYTCKP